MVSKVLDNKGNHARLATTFHQTSTVLWNQPSTQPDQRSSVTLKRPKRMARRTFSWLQNLANQLRRLAFIFIRSTVIRKCNAPHFGRDLTKAQWWLTHPLGNVARTNARIRVGARARTKRNICNVKTTVRPYVGLNLFYTRTIPRAARRLFFRELVGSLSPLRLEH